MRITDVQTLLIKAPQPQDYWGSAAWKNDYGETRRIGSADLSRGYPQRWRMRHRWAATIDTVLLRVLTDEGVVGYGESKAVAGSDAVKAYIDGPLRDAVLGLDPLATKVNWDRLNALMRGRGHVQGLHQEAAAGIDIACWDIFGKVAGRPLCDVLGGRCRETLPIYYSGFAGLNLANDDAQRDRLTREVRTALDQGFTAGKIAIGFGKAADIASVELVRSVAGDEFAIMVDALGSYAYADALWLCHAFAERGVGWFETPLTPEDIDGHVELSKHAPLMIANDFLWTLALVKEVVRRGGQLVTQPEVIKASITECRRIAELVDVYNLPFAPHSSLGSVIEYAATCHLGVTVPNLVISEHWANENPIGNAILVDPIQIADGAVTPPDRPGLGIELDLDKLAPYIAAGEWPEL